MKQPACYKSFQTADAERLQDTKEIIKLIVSLFNIKVIRNFELSFRRNRQQTGIFLRQINQYENTSVVVRNLWKIGKIIWINQIVFLTGFCKPQKNWFQFKAIQLTFLLREATPCDVVGFRYSCQSAMQKCR